MKTIIVVRSLGSTSEHWLKRQIHILRKDIEKIIVMGPCDLREIDQIPIISLDLEFQFKYRILVKLFKEDFKLLKTKRLKSILESSKADSVICHYVDFSLNFIDLFKKSDKKIFIYCHGYDITWDLVEGDNPDQYYFDNDYASRVLNLSKYVTFISNSNSTSEKLKSIGIPPGKIKMKYFGVERNEKRKIPSEFTILYLGRLVDFKGPHLVLQSFELACQKGLKGKLVFAGNGPLRITLELMRLNSDYKDHIEILGSVNYSDAQNLYKNASIFAAHNCKGQLTNQEEAFGVSILEAMSFGIPVITGASGGPKETILHGQTGFLCQPFNVKEQTDLFLKYYNEPSLLESHGQNAKEHVERCFNVENEYSWFNEIISN